MYFKKILILCMLCVGCRFAASQDTVISIPMVDVVDDKMAGMINDVEIHFNECSFTKEIPSFVIVSEYLGNSGDKYMVFETRPYNETYLYLQAIMWGTSKWKISIYKGIRFLFLLDDADFSFVKIQDIDVSLSVKNGMDYEYMPLDGKYYLPIRSFEIFLCKDGRCYVKPDCIDIANMERHVVSKNTIRYCHKRDLPSLSE